LFAGTGTGTGFLPPTKIANISLQVMSRFLFLKIGLTDLFCSLLQQVVSYGRTTYPVVKMVPFLMILCRFRGFKNILP
jgi:hypothetical protein